MVTGRIAFVAGLLGGFRIVTHYRARMPIEEGLRDTQEDPLWLGLGANEIRIRAERHVWGRQKAYAVFGHFSCPEDKLQVMFTSNCRRDYLELAQADIERLFQTTGGGVNSWGCFRD